MKRTIVLAGLMVFSANLLLAQQPAVSAPPSAQDIADMQQHMKEMEERIISLEGQVRILKSGQAPPATEAVAPSGTAATPAATPAAEAPVVATAPAAEPNYGGAGGAASKALNP